VHYRPVEGFEGEDLFGYVAETKDEIAEGQVVVFVKPWSEMLMTRPDSLTLFAGQGVVIDILANDRYLGTRTLDVKKLNEVRFESDAFITSDLRVYYRSDPAALGADRFFYILEDDLGNQRIDQVVVNIVNRRINNVAADDVLKVQNVGSVTVALLANDVFVSTPEEITIVPAMHGEAVWDDQARVLRYKPQRDFVGIDRFAYVVVLSDDFKIASQIRVDVRPFNALPQAQDDSVTVSLGRGMVLDVLVNDRDSEGDSLVVLEARSQSPGLLVILNGDGPVFFRSSSLGRSTFTYKIVDHNEIPVTGTVYVTVEENNNALLARDDIAFVEAGNWVNVPVLVNDDYQGDTIRVVAVTVGQYSERVVANSDQTVHYRTGPDYDGDDFFIYTIRDGQGREASAVVFVRIPGGVVGDLDGNGEVGFADFLVFVGGFGAQVGDGNFVSRMDFNADGTVNFPDFLAFVAVFGQ